MTNSSDQINIGWLLPTGKQRMPRVGISYTNHIQKMIDRITGHFHSLWIPDHFMDDERDIPEAMVSLSYLGGLYPNFHLGTAVLGQNYRNPALLAKMSATLQQLTGGRFILGLGAGWKEDEYRAYGFEFPRASVRIAQLAEMVQICKAMWDPAQAAATYRGAYYRIENAICQPKPVPLPPIMIGGGGEQLTLRVVAEHADWWNLPGATPEVYAHKSNVLAQYCEDIGRPPQDIRKTWMGVVSIAPSREQAVSQMDNYPIWPGDVALLGTPAKIVTQMLAYQKLGIDLFILSFTDETALSRINLFIDRVLPEIH